VLRLIELVWRGVEDEIDNTNPHTLLLNYSGPPSGLDALVSREATRSCREDAQYSIEKGFRRALRLFGRSREEEWKPLIRRCIRQGCDIYQSSFMAWEADPLQRRSVHTLIDEILSFCGYLADSKKTIDSWLSVLKDERIDVKAYLRKERELREGHPPVFEHSNGYSYSAIFSTDLDRMWFEKWTDPSLPASLVLEEFKNFGSEICACKKGSYMDYWPCGDMWWDCCNEFGDCFDERHQPIHSQYQKPIEGLLDKWQMRLWKQDLKESRFNRREKRRLVKFYKSQGFRDWDRMPGAWID
jgi:hypothetical protein